MKCALIWSPVECISRRQQQAAASRNLQIGIGNRQLASAAVWYHKSGIAACMTGRKDAFCAASHSNDMPKAKVASHTLPQAGYICVHIYYTRLLHEHIHYVLDSTEQKYTAFVLKWVQYFKGSYWVPVRAKLSIYELFVYRMMSSWLLYCLTINIHISIFQTKDMKRRHEIKKQPSTKSTVTCA